VADARRLRLLDRAMPEFHFRERHSLPMDAPPERIFQELERLDLGRSAVIRGLFRLRGLQWKDLRFERLVSDLHMKRESAEGERLFWGDEYLAGARLGLAWNFAVEEGEGGRIVSTETRVYCSTAWLRAAFGAYWLVIRPFSGWIRIIMLRLLHDQVAHAAPDPSAA
jgi:hypothetical protein